MILALDLFDDPTQWSVLDPDGSASDALVVAAVDGRRADRPAIRIEAAEAAEHTAEVTFDFVDLNPFDDVQLWVRSSVASDSRVGFVAEVSFGATNLSPTAPSNTWRRLVPITATGTWELMTVSITDLPERVRNRCNQLRVRLDTARTFTLDLCEFAAVVNTPIADIDQALAALLNEQLVVEDTPVPAVLTPDPVPGAERYFRIRHLRATSGADRMRTGERRTDFTDTGFLQRPPIEPLDVDYAVEAVGTTRADQQALVDYLITNIAPSGYLEVNGVNAPMAWAGPLTSSEETAIPSVPLRVTVPRPSSFDRSLSLRPHQRVEINVGQSCPPKH